MSKILVDFHHGALLRSLNLLFEDRLGMQVYRPLGMEWFHQGYWKLNDLEDTAKQFLDTDQGYRPKDGTAPLNIMLRAKHPVEQDVYYCEDPGSVSCHKACTFDYFKSHQFDYVLCSIPDHIQPFQDLIRKYQPGARLIFQVGNNWNVPEGLEVNNVLASAKITAPDGVNLVTYHQEFDLDIFKSSPVPDSKKVHSFVNIIQHSGDGWEMYQQLKSILEPQQGFEFKAFGGQCPDGNMTGPVELADKMREAEFIYHVKPGGDGFGHIIHGAYAVGRPVIINPAHYAGQLAEDLLVSGTYIDARQSIGDLKNVLTRLSYAPEVVVEMGAKAAARFREVVDYEKETTEIKKWITNLI